MILQFELNELSTCEAKIRVRELDTGSFGDFTVILDDAFTVSVFTGHIPLEIFIKAIEYIEKQRDSLQKLRASICNINWTVSEADNANDSAE